MIDMEGHVVEACVLSASQPNLGFEEAAVAAARKRVYEPAMIRGTPVPVWFNVVMDFTLR